MKQFILKHKSFILGAVSCVCTACITLGEVFCGAALAILYVQRYGF